MFEFGRHAGFILASYGAVIVVMGLIVLRTVLDYRVQKKALENLEARGVKRRSSSGAGAHTR